MDVRERKLSEMQEIVFWQKLNGQLLRLKRQGKPITDKHHENLQKFCFDNLLFSTVNSNPSLLDVPMALVTDFKKTFIVTHNLRSWTNRLVELLPGTHTLNIEKGLAEAFVSIFKYNRKHNLIQNIGREEDEDEELNEFLNAYLDAKEKAGIDIPLITEKLHRLKGIALRKIMKTLKYKKYLTREDNLIFLNFEGPGTPTKDVQRAKEIYSRAYLLKATYLVGGGNDIRWMRNKRQVTNILKVKLEETNVKRSIEHFAKWELEVCKSEIETLYRFRKSLIFGDPQRTNKILVLNTQPFFFIDHPLPLEKLNLLKPV